jgi:transcriptional regulator with XRE-family HTH domain
MDDLGDKIRNLRIKAGLTQEALAEELKVSRVTITRYENGERTPKIEKLLKIAAFLKVDVSVLLEATNYKDITAQEGEDVKIYQVMLAPIEGYKDYIKIFKMLGYKVFEHIGNIDSMGTREEFIFDIIYDNKVVITLDLNGFCKLGDRVSKHKQNFDRSLRLLIDNTVEDWQTLHGLHLNECTFKEIISDPHIEIKE